jgi:hypothetical protein
VLEVDDDADGEKEARVLLCLIDGDVRKELFSSKPKKESMLSFPKEPSWENAGDERSLFICSVMFV